MLSLAAWVLAFMGSSSTLRASWRSSLIASLRQKLKSQRPGHRRRFDEAHRHPVAEAVALAARVPDPRMPVLVVAEIFAADGARRDETVSAGVVELDEQPRARDPGNMPLETRAHSVGQKTCEQAVKRFAFRLHGAPLGPRARGGDLAERARTFGLRQGAVAEPEGGDEAGVEEEVGRTADRRGEMGIAPQIETEMAVILGGIF